MISHLAWLLLLLQACRLVLAPLAALEEARLLTSSESRLYALVSGVRRWSQGRGRVSHSFMCCPSMACMLCAELPLGGKWCMGSGSAQMQNLY